MLILTAVVCATLAAQDTLKVDETTTTFHWGVSGGAAYQLESDLDDGGDFSVFRAGADLSGDFTLSPTLRLGLGVGYGFDSYDFSSTTSLGVDPWEDIHTVNFSGRVGWDFADRWTAHFGGLVNFSGEDAEWSDAVTGGGLIAASYKVTDSLTLGGGVGIVSQIEDDAQFFPVIIVDWKINEMFHLGTATRPTVPSATSRGGLEFICTPNDEWEFAVGGRYDVRRFRLDDEGVAPDGVGEDVSLPLWFRAGYKFNENIRFDAFTGFAAFSELTLDDSDGDELANDDADPALFFGGSVSIKF
jgi:hypothetical protein